LVTGASGFLGGHLVHALLARGTSVRILARRTSNLSHLDVDAIEVVHGSLQEQERLREACEGVTAVYHCAGMSADWGAWEAFHAVNVAGTQSLIAAARDARTVERFLHISTTDVYGYPAVACQESYGIRDIGLPYNRSKGLAEKIVWEVHEASKLPVTVIRPASIYGPRSQEFVVEIGKLLLEGWMMFINHGTSRAGLVYVENAVQGIIAACESDKTVGRAYNLRDEADTTWAQYVADLARGIGTRLPWIDVPERVALRIGKVMEGAWRLLKLGGRPVLTRHAAYLFCRDQGYPIDRARRDFGFESTVSYPEGLRRSLEWLDSPEGRQALPRK
jgi:nucleoside-diphosphate-sugar epimerase